jgi:hypothetical protein
MRTSDKNLERERGRKMTETSSLNAYYAEMYALGCSVCGEHNLEEELCFNCKGSRECLNCCGCEV